MTEVEWLACEKPELMLRFLQNRTSDRKLRLFACSCCRRIWGRTVARGRLAIEAAERYADGRAGSEQLTRCHDAAWDAMGEEIPAFGLRTPRFHPVNAAWYASSGEDTVIGGYANAASQMALMAFGETELTDEKIAQASLFRDIIGTPFCPVAINAACLTPTVRSLAHAAYDERLLPSGELDPFRLAVLSDALEEAGCDDVVVLSHLREAVAHVRGCFVIDALTGRS